MAKRRTKAEIAAEKALSAALQRAITGRSINVMDMSKYSNEAEALIAGGTPLDEACKIAAEKWSKVA